MNRNVDFKALAELACLSLDGDGDALEQGLREMIAFADALLAYPPAEGADASEMLGASVLRADEAREGLPREALLDAAPQRDGDYISVPRVLGGEDE